MAEKIGQILIRKGKITAAQLRDALRTQQFFGGYLGSHLINLGFIDEASLGETLSEIYRVPFAPYESIRLAKPDAIAKLPADIAQRYRVIPLHIDGNRIHLAMLNPRDAAAVKEVTAATGLTVAPWVAPEFRIVHALDRHYRIRRERRGSIAVNASSPTDQDQTAEEGRPGVWKDPGAPNLGLDGLPIDATVAPELGGTFVGPRPPGPLPRSLEEWRDTDEGRGPTGPPPPPSRRSSEQSPVLPARAPEEAADSGTTAASRPEDHVTHAKHGSDPGSDPGFEDTKGEYSEARVKSSEGRALPKSAIYHAVQDLDRLSESLSTVGSRDDLARDVVTFLGGKFKRAAAFAVRSEQIVGWVGGERIPPDRLAATVIPVVEPSIFGPALKSCDVYVGSVPQDPGALSFYDSLGIAPPPALLMIPVVLRDRVVAFLYADNHSDALGPIDLTLWRRLASITAMSLEILIIKGKMRRT